MKYYAVTEDPNELFHYGRLGMKWGKHIFGDKPKSPGYHKALGKLKSAASAKNQTNTIKASNTNYKRLQREQDRYTQAVQKAQRNNELVENLNAIDKGRVYERGIDHQYRRDVKRARMIDKQNRMHDKIDYKMEKYMQKARQGKLKYGQMSDDQVRQITERLSMEQAARKLGSTEKTWHQQKKDARRAGKLKGITEGTAAAMTEVARAGTQYGINHLLNRMTMKTKASQEGKNERLKNAQKNRKTRKEINREIRDEAYEARVRNSEENLFNRALHLRTATNAEYLLDRKNREKIENEQKRLKELDEQLKNKAYERIVIGTKNDKTEDIIKRLGNLDTYYEQIYGKERPNYDQPVPKKPLSTNEIIEKAVKKAANRSRERINQYTYDPVISRMTGGQVINDIDPIGLNLPTPRKPRRRDHNNPLKG